ncbi:poly(A) RNA polymerase gld-2 homolog A-like [Leptidea sinapis]|uniref:poly(A) RNA polymerase gld-2 homolog A-like n=1 Tax=Leptidea sinapis TaxID=189913 RepID=UPI00212EBFEE|nr:poly(A) RNA polymerase gld-2 homolog A-like [Leptidea sinapis]
MNEGASTLYHSNGFGGSGAYNMGHMQMERQNRQYPYNMLNGGINSSMSPRQGTQRRWQPRRDRRPIKGENTAFGYDSDDSSLSSNASGSNKSSEKGGNTNGDTNSTGSEKVSREWRSRNRRDQKPRRIAPDRFLTASYPFQVKYTPDDLLTGSKWDSLSQDIWDKFVKSQQTEATFHKKMNLWKYLYITIKSIFPRYGLYVVGSTMSGFGLESSDMDLCLFVRAMSQEPRAHALSNLDFILPYIRAFDPDAELIQAKVPILKFRDARNGVQVDLNCNNVVGIKNTNLLYCLSTMDWRVRPLVSVSKLWARAHHINDARRRTLSSYALTLMVVHFLQCGTSPAILPRASDVMCGHVRAGVRRSHNRASLGELFLSMLRYYADFPYEQTVISVRSGRRIPLDECRPHLDPYYWKHICVEEPFDLSNTARSVYDPDTFEKIVVAFRDSYRRLAAGLRLSDAWPTAR